jgi:geranyl-CoA carboxylase alpha subunit
MSFGSVLVANRGEIAMRIGRTLRRMGLGWVAVHAPDEAGAPHVAAADVSVAVPSYLDGPALVAAARSAGAGAVHPGYGFLSENPDFAEAVIAAGLVWIGPPPGAMRLMADKGAAKAAAAAAGVPVLPGWRGEDRSGTEALAAAAGIGFPLMVKAAAGGGGRGMRLVRDAAALPAALARARSEAEAAFGDGRLILERAVEGARHIEVQVMADAAGAVLALGERDCSVQRRHQKLIEEAPAPGLDAPRRARLAAAAIAVARAAGYVGAGTVEFLVEPDGAFWFLEMNTRLQVEHPVTEAVTGLDLVEWQIRVARGEALPEPSALRFSGHAIEVRLCAEDPAQGFLPQTGRVLRWRPPEGLRCDHALAEGLAVGAGYDSMLAKLIAHGPDRETARRRLLAGLAQTELLGVRSNRRFLAEVLAHPAFVAGAATTGFLDTLRPEPRPPAPRDLALAAGLAALAAGRGDPRLGWSTGPALPRRMRFESGGALYPAPVTIARAPEGLKVALPGTEVVILGAEGGRVRFRHAGCDGALPFARDGAWLWLGDEVLRDATHDPAPPPGAGASGTVAAPMAGRLVALAVAEGQAVAAGQLLAVIEAMKMEHPLTAPHPGRVAELTVRAGQQVAARQVLMRIAEEP